MIIQDNNFLTQQEVDLYRDSLLILSPWSFKPWTNTKSTDGAALASQNESFQFVSSIDPDHPMRVMTLELLHKFLSKHNIPIKQITRIKSNILTKSSNSGYHSPHIDHDFEHKVFLYYVNDSDGDTIFFNEFWSSDNPATEETLTEQIRVAPQQGLGVVFDGFQYHASTSPQDNKFRCVVNIPFISK
jgi:hypothetical protein